MALFSPAAFAVWTGTRRCAATVADAMVTDPKIAPSSMAVGEAWNAFGDEHVHALLLVEDGLLLGVVERDDLTGLAEREPAVAAGRLRGRTVAPRADLHTVLRTMRERSRRRLAVIDDAGSLLGLLCLKSSGSGFCSDAGIRARAVERSSGSSVQV